jgi:hypothetical protein
VATLLAVVLHGHGRPSIPTCAPSCRLLLTDSLVSVVERMHIGRLADARALLNGARRTPAGVDSAHCMFMLLRYSVSFNVR